jgi:hypothetical protein
VLDSGCTQYMTGNGRMFTSIDNKGSKCDKINFGDISKVKVKDWVKLRSLMIYLFQMSC